MTQRKSTYRKDECFVRSTRWELRALAEWTTFDVCVFSTVRCRWSPSSSAFRSCSVLPPPPSIALIPAWSSVHSSVLCPASQTCHSNRALKVKRLKPGTWYSATCEARASGALQPWKWCLIGTGYSSLVRRKLSSVTDSGPADATSRHTTPRPATLGLHPVIRVPNNIDYYSFTDLWRIDGWVGQGTQHAALYNTI